MRIKIKQPALNKNDCRASYQRNFKIPYFSIQPYQKDIVTEPYGYVNSYIFFENSSDHNFRIRMFKFI